MALVESERDDQFLLDKDTQGVPGMPPISEVIFDKITNCGIFVPDLSFVGSTQKGRALPNPNVLIEYGWALNSLGYQRIVPVLNSAFGDPSEKELPFDMRHLRRPITYKLSKSSTPKQKSAEKIKLEKDFVRAFQLILKSGVIKKKEPESLEQFIETQSTTDPSTFFETGEKIGSVGRIYQGDTQLTLPDNEHLFLRIIPTQPVPEFPTSKAALDIMRSSEIRPFGIDISGWNSGRNKFGAIAVENVNEKVLAFTQLFKNHEIWGIDTQTIDKESNMDWFKTPFGYFPSSNLEKSFLITLESYLEFCNKIIKLPLPLKVIAGATNVGEFKIYVPEWTDYGPLGRFVGEVFEQHIIYDGQIDNYEDKPETILRPFFEKIWEEAGFERPDKDRL